VFWGAELVKTAKQDIEFVSNLSTPPVYKVIVAQLVVTAFMAAFSLLFSGIILAYSVLLGGLISALPNSYFVLHAFKYQGARNAEKVVKGFIKGELGKIVITIALFALSFTLVSDLNELALILGFIVTHFVGVMMSGLIARKPAHKRS
jgi:ATP synthase protein I